MRKYSGSGVAAAGLNLTIVQASQTGATVRTRIYDIIVGSDSSPADQATKFALQRGTVAGTGSSFTPVALDPADPASLVTFQQGTFTGQTLTANAYTLFFAVNQRATFRWVAAPDSELVLPATTAALIALQSLSSTGTPNIDSTFLWQE